MQELYDSMLRIIPRKHGEGYGHLMEKLHFPFDSEQLMVSFENLSRQLKPHLQSYNAIVGDDISGRLPTLIVARLANRKMTQAGLAKPSVYFINAG